MSTYIRRPPTASRMVVMSSSLPRDGSERQDRGEFLLFRRIRVWLISVLDASPGLLHESGPIVARGWGLVLLGAPMGGAEQIGEKALQCGDTPGGEVLEVGLLFAGVLDERLQGLGSLDQILTPDGLQVSSFLRGESPERDPLEDAPLPVRWTL